jgi:hypothetical protein
MMHGPMNVKSSDNISKWQMGFNSAFKGLIMTHQLNGIGTKFRSHPVKYST